VIAENETPWIAPRLWIHYDLLRVLNVSFLPPPEGPRTGSADRSRSVARFSRQIALVLLAFAGPVALALPQENRAQPSDAEAPQAYVIGAADVLQITVWKEPELSRDATVRLDGVVTVPLLGDTPAAGKTPTELADDISKKLAKFIEKPRVSIGITQANSSRIYIIGQMVRSGEFPLLRRMTVLQGLALAGGFKEFAKTESIVIVRQDKTVVPVNYKRIADGRDMSQNVALTAGDTIVVP
jgi:polysaccharide export outer membrane protein